MHEAWTLLVLVLGLVAGVHGAAAAEPEGQAKVYLGREGEKIIVVQLKPAAQNLAAIRFENVEGPWNGKVLRHRRTIMGADREDFALDTTARHYVSLTLRFGQWTAYPSEAPRAIELQYSRKDSEQTDAGKIVEQLVPRESGH